MSLSLWLFSLKSALESPFPNDLHVGSKGGRGEHKKEIQEKDSVQSEILITHSKKR